VRVRVAAPLHPSRGTALAPTLSRCAGEGDASPSATRNPSHAPSTPCQAENGPRHSFPWPHRPMPPMVRRPGSNT
jgi:hypothetical protein